MAGPPLVLPDAIAALGDDVAARVHELVHAAEQDQIREGDRATDEALRMVPRPLRPVIRKVVGV